MLRERDARLESLKALTGRLAHDFRNLLVPQLGYVTLIKEETSEGSALAAYASKLENASQKAESYLDSILLATRPQRRFSPKPANFAEVVERALKSWKTSLPPEPLIKVQVSLAPCTLVIDADQWRNVVLQILTNARLALVNGGFVDVVLRAAILSPERASELNVRGADAFELVFQDNGVGMCGSILHKACEPFFSTRPKSQAAGLGLTLAHSVVQLHGGQLALESEEGKGTTVRIWLPQETVRAAQPCG